MNGIEFAQTMSDLRRLLHFLPDETGPEHTQRIFAIAERLQAGTVTWEQVQVEEQYRVERGLVQLRGGTAAARDAERRAARDGAWLAWHRRFESPIQRPMSVREERTSPKQRKLNKARERYSRS
jgi:hypothetical protein